ncbi:EAL domain-containing protein [Pseudoalteromonas tunicata]|uniref:EAL domain-containing protein n=1 Tax=Pseudoalteromonas tunicata TaxID=314281 RepID=UPI0027402B4B|nr:EAL domain-containing protein [Pseudoalteromonas tunicata]MDP5214380.1 EAL domain-containing protein [Pseudoalteromonas tunicata]
MQMKSKAITAADVMSANLVTCDEYTTLAHAAKIMKKHNVSAIFVTSKGQIIGIWTESDCAKVDFLASNFAQTCITDSMSSPVKKVTKQTLLSDVTAIFHHHHFRHLLVVDESSQPIGMISLSDVVKNQGLEHYLHFRQVEQSFNAQVPIIDSEQSINDVAQNMRRQRVNAVLVFNQKLQQTGIITERDLLHVLADNKHQSRCWSLASWPLLTIRRDISLYRAYHLLKANNIRHLVVEDQDLNICGILSLSHIITDIEAAYMTELETVLSQRNQALKTSQKNLFLAKQIINASLDGVMITDNKGTIFQVNPAFTTLTGYSAEDVVGQTPSLLSSGKHDKIFYDRMWQCLRREHMWQGEIWNKKKNGEVYLEWLTIIEIKEPDDDELLYAAIFSDITERKKAEKRIISLAYFDELTHLPNRRLFSDRLEMALATAHRDNSKLAVMFLDLDHFKQINDTMGHNVGDILLRQVAERLQACVREGDTLARLGGDEFTLLITEISDVEQLTIFAHKLIHQLQAPFKLNGLDVSITTSIGAAVYPDDGIDSQSLLKHADVAMYRSKDLGRNSFQLYKPAMNARSLERLAMESKFKKALRTNEFKLCFQPQIDAKHQRLTGLEALVRWQSPELGSISPAQFIPLAENLGLIVELDIWVINKACQQIRLWLDEGVPFAKVSVNVSALHFSQGNLVLAVQNALHYWHVDPHWVEIEITETSFISSLPEAKKVLTNLKKLGVKIALDDFGTGYSALSYLTQLPIDTVKIDASFIAKVPDEYGNSQIVTAIIALAKSLRLGLVAEGVEKAAQLRFLEQLECYVIQGFYFSKPLYPCEYVRFIAQKKFSVLASLPDPLLK